jgi:hypothetical protein
MFIDTMNNHASTPLKKYISHSFPNYLSIIHFFLAITHKNDASATLSVISLTITSNPASSTIFTLASSPHPLQYYTKATNQQKSQINFVHRRGHLPSTHPPPPTTPAPPDSPPLPSKNSPTATPPSSTTSRTSPLSLSAPPSASE